MESRSVASAGTGPVSPMSPDPTKELRSYIEGLQEEARVARRQQEAAEEDRDRLAEEVRRLHLELEAANEARKEVRNVIVERDNLRSALERNETVLVEIRRRADTADRQRAQVESQRDQAVQLYKESKKEAEQHVAGRDEAARQRDAALRQRAQVLRDHEETTAKLAEAQRTINDLQKSLLEAQAGANKTGGDVQKQLLAIRQARDSAAAQAQEFKARIGELEDTIAELTYDREVSDKATKKAVVELESFRGKAEDAAEKLVALETLQAELAEVGQELTELRQQHASVQGAKEQLVVQLREFRETHEAQLIANTSHLEAVTKERDLIRTRLQEREGELQEVRAELANTWANAMQVTEPEIERLTKEVEGMKDRAAQIDSVVERSEEMTRQREEMRLLVIELNAQLENARREIKEIGAQLAESRLQLKLASKGAPVPPLARPILPQSEVTVEVEAVEAAWPDDRCAAMKTAWERWQENTADSDWAWALAREAAAFSGSCQAAGQLTLYRVASRLAALAETVLSKPDRAMPRVQGLIGDTIHLLTGLGALSTLDTIVKLTGRRAYVVENDIAVSHEMCEALRSTGFIVDATLHASSAIAELSVNSCDVVVIDSYLPEFDGFELHDCIRGIDQHVKTPVLIAVDEDPEAGRAEGATFVSKPCIAEELALRAVIEVVKAQIEAA